MFSIPVPFDSLALVYVGRIVFESDISLRRIRRVEFRGNSHEEYYRSVRPPSLSSLLLPLLFLHFLFSVSVALGFMYPQSRYVILIALQFGMYRS